MSKTPSPSKKKKKPGGPPRRSLPSEPITSAGTGRRASPVPAGTTATSKAKRTPPSSPYRAGSSPAPSSRSLRPPPVGVCRVRVEPYTEREAKVEQERRRGLVFVHLRTLQGLGVVIGDPVVLLGRSNGDPAAPVPERDANSRGVAGALAVGQAWMSANAEEDEVHVDALMADNCGVRFGDMATLQRLDPLAGSRADVTSSHERLGALVLTGRECVQSTHVPVFRREKGRRTKRPASEWSPLEQPKLR